MLEKQDMSAAPVTLYADATDTFGQRVTFSEFMRRRALNYETGNSLEHLPCITVGGQFTRRKLGWLHKASGLIHLEFSAKDNSQVDDWQEVKKKVCSIDELESFAALSAFEHGAFVLYHDPMLQDIHEVYGAPSYLQAHRRLTNFMARRLYDVFGLTPNSEGINTPNYLRCISADNSPAMNTFAACQVVA